MTLASAQAAAADLRTALLDNGVKRVSLELQEGVAGSGWGVAPFKRGLGHHIASYPPGTPGLGTVKRGRGQPNPLTGPLSNAYGGFDLTARIITLGWANHPGAGGPWSVPGWGTVPRDNGRAYIFGWEFEGGFLPYTDEMHEFMARCGAGTLDWLGSLPGNPGPAPIECWDEHKGWAGRRKPDRIGYTTASGRSRIAAVRGTAPTTPTITPEDDMDLNRDTFKNVDGVDITLPMWANAVEKDLRDLKATSQPAGEDGSYVDWDQTDKDALVGDIFNSPLFTNAYGVKVALRDVLNATEFKVTGMAASLGGEIAGLRSALEQVAANPAGSVDLEAVRLAAQDGARSIVDNLKVVAEPDA